MVVIFLKVSLFLDDITRGMVRQVNILQMRISAILVLTHTHTHTHTASTTTQYKSHTTLLTHIHTEI